ncbi:MAG: sugar ABC transporter substrate-binding protein [Chloroflexota bacterium]|nr:sugar ABC transporter substrate-binding protein [Chloroflexota bacterium]
MHGFGTHLTRRQALRLLGAGAGMALVAACGPSSTQTGTPGQGAAGTAAPVQQQAPAQTQQVSLRWFFWTGSEEERQFWEGMATDAAKSIGNLEVKFETDSFTNYWTKLPTYAASGTVADILGLQSLRTATFTSRNLYQPMDDLIKSDSSFDLNDFDKTIVDGLSYKGKLYALSYDFGPYIVFYNKTLFQKTGTELPKPDWTWDQFLQTAKSLTKETDGRQIAGLVSSNVFDRVVPWIFSNGGDYANEDFTKSQLSSPATIEAIQWYADLLRKERVEPEISDPGNADADRDQFLAGRAAMYINGPWQFINMRSKLKDDWDVTLLPKGKAGSVAQVAGSGFGISSSTKYREQAWQVVKYVTSSEGLKKVAAAGRGFPGRKSAVEAFFRKDQPPEHQDVIQAQLQTSRAYRTNPTWQEVVTQLQRDLLDPILLQGKPVREAVQAAEPNFQALIDKGLQQQG